MPDTKTYCNSFIDPSDNQQKYFRDLDAAHDADASNPSSVLGAIKQTADTARTIAEGAQNARVFDTQADMETWLKDPANKLILKVGDNLYIKDTNVPDYWVSAVYGTVNPEGFYYNFSPLETGKVNLSNVVTTDSDIATSLDFVFGLKGNISKRVATSDLLPPAMPMGGIYESVDLGLPSGRKWARMNVGANSEEEYGDLFAWGATKPYRVGIDSTDNYAASKAATIRRNLLPNEDAATVNMGQGWRMPTKADYEELRDNTDVEWTKIGNAFGKKFMKKSDNSVYVFFPASGYVSGSSLINRDSFGNYWSCQHNSNSSAWRFFLRSTTQSVSSYDCYTGFSVRGVRS